MGAERCVSLRKRRERQNRNSEAMRCSLGRAGGIFFFLFFGHKGNGEGMAKLTIQSRASDKRSDKMAWIRISTRNSIFLLGRSPFSPDPLIPWRKKRHYIHFQRANGADVDVRRHLQDDLLLLARHATAVLHLRRPAGLNRLGDPRAGKIYHFLRWHLLSTTSTGSQLDIFTGLDVPGQDEQAEEVRV